MGCVCVSLMRPYPCLPVLAASCCTCTADPWMDRCFAFSCAGPRLPPPAGRPVRVGGRWTGRVSSPGSCTWRVRAATCRAAGRGVCCRRNNGSDLTCAGTGGSVGMEVHGALARAGHLRLRHSARACAAAALAAWHYRASVLNPVSASVGGPGQAYQPAPGTKWAGPM